MRKQRPAQISVHNRQPKHDISCQNQNDANDNRVVDRRRAAQTQYVDQKVGQQNRNRPELKVQSRDQR